MDKLIKKISKNNFLKELSFKTAYLPLLGGVYRKIYQGRINKRVNNFKLSDLMVSIEHQKDPRLFLRSILAPLEKGGYLYLATPNVANLLNRIRFLFGRPPLGNLKDFFVAGEDFDGHWREYSLNELHLFFVWLDIEVIMAKNVQSMKPSLRIKKFRDLYVNLFRFLGSLIPSCGDANILIGKIKQDGPLPIKKIL